MRGMNSESVDLIATDPPFNTGRLHNSLTQGTRKVNQQFNDRWCWDDVTDEWHDLLAADRPAIKEIIEAAAVIEGGSIDAQTGAIKTGRIKTSIAAFLAYMAPRILEMHRILKPTGTLWIQCDDEANSYLRLLLDAVFGRKKFINEIIRRRKEAKGNATRRLPRNHDTILVYGKKRWKWNGIYDPYDLENLDEKTKKQYGEFDGNRRYSLGALNNPAKDRPNLTYEFLGVTRVWRWTKERMQKAYEEGRIVQTAPGNVPREIRYLDEQKGKTWDTLWMGVMRAEGRNVKWETRKPTELFRRAVNCATDPGDLVLDPFCGCGTTCAAAEVAGRRWIGIDMDPVAEEETKKRLAEDTAIFGEQDGYKTSHNPVKVKKRPPQRTDIPKTSDNKMRDSLWKNQGKRCGNPYCQSENVRKVDIQLDHRIPKSRSGPNDITNRIGLCGDCNRRKGRKAWGTFLDQERGKQPHPTVTTPNP